MAAVIKPEPRREVYIQLWQYRSSGPPSESGFSLHFLKKNWEEYLLEFWRNKPCVAPSTYECQFGQAFVCAVTAEMLLQVKNSGNGIKLYAGIPDGIPVNFLEPSAWKKAKYPCPE